MMTSATHCRFVTIRLIILIALIAAMPFLSAVADTQPVDFNREVLPILSDRCFQCHGPDSSSREADLRLDDRAVAVDELGVIVPGEPEWSEIIRRIESEDEWEVMPPPDAHKQPISEAERQTLIRWIREGAEYRPHWSFVRPQRPELPEVADPAWVRQPLDRFVLARLEGEGLLPSPEADRRMLIRRLSFDLTGLPPSAEEVEAFAADQAHDAYERLVERLLSSPHFGERMALAWLDAARYADTNGYSIDGGRHMWLWRDWVIDAFNRNLPYDEFLVEQLAGDLLPEPTDAQLIATGFQRNAMVTHEAGTIPKENLTNYTADRVKTLGEAVLGLTLGCAQCHDHKYDPISQRDYYRLFAYFNTLSELPLDGDGGVNARPSFQAKTVLQTGELPELERRIAELQRQLANSDADALAAWEAQQRDQLATRGRELELHSVRLLTISTPNAGEGFDIEEGRYAVVTDPAPSVAYDVSMQLPRPDQPISGLRIVFHPRAEEPNRGPGFGTLEDGEQEANDEQTANTFVLSSFSASADAVPGDQINLNRLLEIRQVTAGSWIDKYLPENVLDPRNKNGWSPDVAQEGTLHLTVTFEQPLDVGQSHYLTAQLYFGQGRQLIAARFEVFAMTGVDDDSPLPADIIEIVQLPGSERSKAEQQRLGEYFAAHAEATRPLRIALANLEERRAVLTQEFSTLIMDVAEKPRVTHILNRGDYSQPTEQVDPGTPAVLPPLPDDEPSDRLGLAHWIVMSDHPLTARVAANRLWQLCFGEGIVRTPADFGARGRFPTHPELLDWLAVEFQENGWDVKALLRSIVLSATYRQSSASRQELLDRDPSNQLLARGPRFRLPAEFIRDTALRVSGLLVGRLGGPSVNPYMPADLWREVSHYGSTSATAQAFVQDFGEKLYRRSLYTYWKRTVPPPNMAAFDAPSREVCVVSRPATNTPLQALVLLNDVQFVEAARAFAGRIVHYSVDDAERLRWAALECLSRPPTESELAILQEALDRERDRYESDEAAALSYLANGESPRDESIPPAEHAAWSQIATLLLNLSESVTRN